MRPFYFYFSAQSETDTIPEHSDDASSYEYSYDYGEDGNDEIEGEEEEEGRPSFNPQFTTEAQHFKVPAQHTTRLPCRVDRLGTKSI